MEDFKPQDTISRFEEFLSKSAILTHPAKSGLRDQKASHHAEQTRLGAEVPILLENNVGTNCNREIDLYIGRDWKKGRLVDRGGLATGVAIAGPALLEDLTSSLFLPEGWQAIRDEHHNTVITTAKSC